MPPTNAERIATNEERLVALTAAVAALQEQAELANAGTAATREKDSTSEWRAAGFLTMTGIRGNVPPSLRMSMKDSDRKHHLRKMLHRLSVQLKLYPTLVENLWVLGDLIPPMFLSTLSGIDPDEDINYTWI